MNRIAFTLVLALVAAGVLAVAGCTTTAFPYNQSIDRHAFPSTPSMPVTLQVIDALTDEELLVIDVPVGKTLVIDFDTPGKWTATQTASWPADRVQWVFVDPGTRFNSGFDHEMALPGNPVYMKPIYRDPEPIGSGVAQTGPGQAAEAPAVPIQRDPEPVRPEPQDDADEPQAVEPQPTAERSPPDSSTTPPEPSEDTDDLGDVLD